MALARVCACCVCPPDADAHALVALLLLADCRACKCCARGARRACAAAAAAAARAAALLPSAGCGAPTPATPSTL
jgi:hypothetical protein